MPNVRSQPSPSPGCRIPPPRAAGVRDAAKTTLPKKPLSIRNTFLWTPKRRRGVVCVQGTQGRTIVCCPDTRDAKETGSPPASSSSAFQSTCVFGLLPLLFLLLTRDMTRHGTLQPQGGRCDLCAPSRKKKKANKKIIPYRHVPFLLQTVRTELEKRRRQEKQVTLLQLRRWI